VTRRKLDFLKDLDKGDLTKYSDSYKRVFMHRILKKQYEVIECALLINKLRDKLEALNPNDEKLENIIHQLQNEEKLCLI
jgi:hypothetical protein